MDTNGQKQGGNHERHEKPWFGHILNHEWTLMDTNGQKPGVTTKNTNHTRNRVVGMF